MFKSLYKMTNTAFSQKFDQKLKFIALSGTTDVTENLYVYEYGNDLLVVDCGVGFPESEMHGVDLVIPDFTYIKENKHRLKAILITHGHEDHIGALPFLLREINAPIYSTKLVAGFIEEKLADYKVKNIKVNIFDPERDVLTFGVFKVTPFRVSHSVPDAVGFAIDTPEGKMFHVPDYKFDFTPVFGKPFDVAKVAQLASDGVLALASDCLGSTTPGFTESEITIEARIEEIVRRATKGLYFTTISSNISRIQQAINVAQRYGRKIAFVGYSIDSKAEIAERLGYLHYPPNLVVHRKKAARMPKDKVMFIVSGAYGQVGSNMYRLATSEHDLLSITKDDIVIFSADPAPPGTKEDVDYIVDKLIELGADVSYYDLQEDLHTSGHGSQGDIKMLFGLVKPKYFIPIGGTVRFMKSYKDLAILMGARDEQVFMPMAGDIIAFAGKNARLDGNIPVKNVLVDGLGIGDVGKVVLRDRKVLAEDGVVVALMSIDIAQGAIVGTEIVSRGFVFEEKDQGLLAKASQGLTDSLKKKGVMDKKIIKNEAITFLEKHFDQIIGRRPMIIPVIVEI